MQTDPTCPEASTAALRSRKLLSPGRLLLKFYTILVVSSGTMLRPVVMSAHNKENIGLTRMVVVFHAGFLRLICYVSLDIVVNAQPPDELLVCPSCCGFVQSAAETGTLTCMSTMSRRRGCILTDCARCCWNHNNDMRIKRHCFYRDSGVASKIERYISVLLSFPITYISCHNRNTVSYYFTTA